MPLQPIYMAPGICKVNSTYASGKTFAYGQGRIAQGRYTDGNHIRFIAGFPEKIGGFIGVGTKLTDAPRAMTDWRDNNQQPQLAIATVSHLYSFNGMTVTDITPLRTISTGTLTNPITTVSGSATVAITDASQNVQNGDWVFLSAAAAVGGVLVNGWYQVSGRTSGGYNITVPIAATGNAGPAGGTTQFSYPRRTLGSNPFSTQNGSPTVTVTDTAHGATTGDYVDFSGATTVAGLTLNNEYQLTVVNANSYTINAGANANATTTGGGSAVSVTYDITISQSTITQPVVFGATGVPFGVGPFGYSSSSTSSIGSWTLAAYGNQLLSCPVGGTIYVYNPVFGGRSYPLLNAPTGVLAMFVTAERFVFALGTSSSELQLAWADQNDYTNWTSTAVDTANSGRNVQGGLYFVGGITVGLGTSLMFTNRSVFLANYIGTNFIYNTPLIADGAPLVGPNAATAYGGSIYWMSDHDFWIYNGSVNPLPSDDIRDFVFSNINTNTQWKAVVGTNREKKEIWFHYPSVSSSENDSYVIYHVDQGCWSIGQPASPVARSAWRDSEQFNSPYACDALGNIYQHEIGTDANGAALDAEVVAAPIDISNGSTNLDVFGFWQDFERLVGTANLTINTRFYAPQPDTVSGPFAINSSGIGRIDLRIDGKMLGFKIESNQIGGDFRLGLPRYDAQPSGARR